jgi:hypothetical protein
MQQHNLMHGQSAAAGWFIVAEGNKLKSSASLSLFYTPRTEMGFDQ